MRSSQRSYCIAGWMALVVVMVVRAPAAQPALRPLPYPHAHVVSFASDVDMQPAWWTAAFHRLVNERLGLPVSDSLWVHGQGPGELGYLFSDAVERNRAAAGVDGHPVYGLLVRLWHRGWIDHLHSWQNGSVFRLRTDLDPPLTLVGQSVTVPLAPLDETLRGTPYGNLRLVFDRPPSDLLAVIACDRQGRTARANGEALLRAAADYGGTGVHPETLDVVFSPQYDMHVVRSAADFSFQELDSLTLLYRPQKGEPPKLVRIERDHFSRRTVLRQAAALARWNVRPAFVTGHGGFDISMDLGEPLTFTEQRRPGTVYANPLVDVVKRIGGSNPASFAYHADVLERLGMICYWDIYSRPYFDRQAMSSHDERPALRPTAGRSYTITRNAPFLRKDRLRIILDRATAEDFARCLTAAEPLLQTVDLRSFYVGDTAYLGDDQGPFLGILIALGLKQAEAGRPVDQLWYTHFGTINYVPGLKLTPAAPLTAAIESQCRRLAEHYYNVSGRTPPGQRIWVAPASGYVRYRIAQQQAAEHVRVDAATSRVDIEPWTDPVTRRRVPDDRTGLGDLHGLTIYVPDAGRAEVRLGGKPVRSFTRNPADGSKRQSVTLVDDHCPTVLLGKVAPAECGRVEADGGELVHRAEKDGAARTRLVATRAGTVRATVRPRQLELWNTTHVYARLRKTSQGAGAEPAVALRLRLAGGQSVEAAEGQGGGADAWWPLPPLKTGAWTDVTLAADQLRFKPTPADRAALPLPLGRVEALELELRGAAPGDAVEFEELAALRPDSGGANPAGELLVMGRATKGEAPAAGVHVVARAEGGRRDETLTDADGYYAFYNFCAGEVLSIRAGEAAPQRGRRIELRKNEAELDIAL